MSQQPESVNGAGEPLELTSEKLLEIIFSYAGKIANEHRLDWLLMFMRDMGRELVVADRCTVWLVDRTRGELFTYIAHGIDEIRIPMGSGLAGHAVQTGETICIEDAYLDERFNPGPDQQSGYRTRAILVIPFRNNDGEIAGCYQAINKMTPAGVFSRNDQERLALAASYAGKSLESAMLYREIEETQREIIFAMGEIGEIRSKETGNHVKRVAEYSYQIALGVGIDPEEAELLRIASPMHDIGKVAIPDAILNKPGKLTKEEFRLMQSHTVIGYELLHRSRRKLLAIAAIVAYQHHEKWNGRGYPQGLKGEEIHLYGRITAIADVFDALGSDRSYKKAWELDRILELIRSERGEHFDPVCVDAFLERLPKLLEIRERYRDIGG